MVLDIVRQYNLDRGTLDSEFNDFLRDSRSDQCYTRCSAIFTLIRLNCTDECCNNCSVRYNKSIIQPDCDSKEEDVSFCLEGSVLHIHHSVRDLCNSLCF
jgi:hypothetical protein